MSILSLILLGTMPGKMAVSTVFALLILLLILLPASVRNMLKEEQLPWWRRTRLWAMVIAAIQVIVYLTFG